MSLPEVRSAVEVVPSLDERRDRIIAAIESAAYEVGEQLLAAKREHPGRFMAWVSEELPFGHDKAQRFMAIARFAGTLDADVLANMPKGWTIFFELRRMDPLHVRRAVEEGAIDPDVTLAEARTLADPDSDLFRKLIHGQDAPPEVLERPGRKGPKPGTVPAANRGVDCDTLARELIRQPRDRLSPRLAEVLRRWLGPEGDLK